MYCFRCGKSLPLESQFCNGCGTNVATKQSVSINKYSNTENSQSNSKSDFPPQAQISDQIIFRTRPSFYSVGNAYFGAAIISIIATAIIGYFNLPVMILLFVIVFSFLFPFLRHVRRNRISYTLTSNKIEIEYGLFSKTVRNIPLRNAQDVTVSATLLERLVRIGDVIIDSAADTGKIQMRQIPNPRKHAELILQQVHRWR